MPNVIYPSGGSQRVIDEKFSVTGLNTTNRFLQLATINARVTGTMYIAADQNVDAPSMIIDFAHPFSLGKARLSVRSMQNNLGITAVQLSGDGASGGEDLFLSVEFADPSAAAFSLAITVVFAEMNGSNDPGVTLPAGGAIPAQGAVTGALRDQIKVKSAVQTTFPKLTGVPLLQNGIWGSGFGPTITQAGANGFDINASWEGVTGSESLFLVLRGGTKPNATGDISPVSNRWQKIDDATITSGVNGGGGDSLFQYMGGWRDAGIKITHAGWNPDQVGFVKVDIMGTNGGGRAMTFNSLMYTAGATNLYITGVRFTTITGTNTIGTYAASFTPGDF